MSGDLGRWIRRNVSIPNGPADLLRWIWRRAYRPVVADWCVDVAAVHGIAIDAAPIYLLSVTAANQHEIAVAVEVICCGC